MTEKERYTIWDVTNYLKTQEDVLLYIEAASEEDPGDGSLIRMALKDIARAQNMSALAREIGVSREGLYKTLSPNGNPSFATIMRLTRALGMQVVIRPIPIDQPEPDDASPPPMPESTPSRSKSGVG